MCKKASSELVVARRRGGSHDRAEDVCVAAADRVQGPLVEDDGDDAVERDDRRVPRARERVVVEAEHLAVGLDDGRTEVLRTSGYTSPQNLGSVSGQAAHCRRRNHAQSAVAPGLCASR